MSDAAADVLFAFACAFLYVCTVATVSPTYERSSARFERQALTAIGGAVLVFALVLWMRL